MRSRSFIFAGIIVTAAIIASVAVARRSASQIAEREALLREQQSQIENWIERNCALSNSVARAAALKDADGESSAAEMKELRAAVAALRRQTNELGAQFMTARRSGGAQRYALGGHILLEHNRTLGASMQGGPREPG